MDREKLMIVLERLQKFKASWWGPEVIDDAEEMWIEAPEMVVCLVPLMEEALGVEPSGPCECDCGRHGSVDSPACSRRGGGH